MYYKHNEIFFNSRKEMLAYLPWLNDESHIDLTLYQCCRCGINFASSEPSTDRGAIICSICEEELLKDGVL